MCDNDQRFFHKQIHQQISVRLEELELLLQRDQNVSVKRNEKNDNDK